MSFKRFNIIQTGDNDLYRIQSNIATTFDPLLDNECLDSHRKINVALVAGKDNVISHELGRVLQGWKITRIRAESIVWDKQDTNTNPGKTLILWCSADVTIDLEMF